MTHYFRDLWNMWEAMRNAQRNLGRDVTTSELKEVFQVDSERGVIHRLNQLAEAGMVTKTPIGKGHKHVYSAKETLESDKNIW